MICKQFEYDLHVQILPLKDVNVGITLLTKCMLQEKKEKGRERESEGQQFAISSNWPNIPVRVP